MTDSEIQPTATATCYRHPDRATSLACSNCSRPICGACSTPGSVGQFCPECLKERGRQRQVATSPKTATRLRRGSPITFGILALTVVAFIATEVSRQIEGELIGNFAQINPLVALREWWRIFTPILLHANITHILFNMYALYQLGPAVEARFGRIPFVLLYLAAAGVGGAFAYHLGGENDVLVGASGAIFGLFGVWLHAAFRMRDTAFGRNLLSSLWISLALNIGLAFLIPGISWQGHLGGLVGGVLIAEAWSRLKARQWPWPPVVIGVLAVIAVLL